MGAARVKGIYALDKNAFPLIYGEEEQRDIASLVDICAPPQTRETLAANPDLARDAEVILSGWGAPDLDALFLSHAPRLKAMFYGAGSVRGIMSDAAWDRGIVITSAYSANAVPVAEYTLSQILFSLKRGWQFALAIKREGKYPIRDRVPGAYRSTVGLITLGQIGRRVCDLLKPFDMKVLAHHPSMTAEAARELNVQLCTLEDIFRLCDVVSLHTPHLPETEGMITGRHFRSMKPGATFINTARGAVVRENEMMEALQERPDLMAILDVTEPEPPVPGSPLYALPNVILTPHIAGSLDNECRRMGRYMVEELRRFLSGQPLQWRVTRERSARLA